MARLPRRHIPLAVRVIVANRQVHHRYVHEQKWPPPMREDGESDGRFLARLLAALFDGKTAHLDHDPALENRQRIVGAKQRITYIPDEHDPDFLVYREGGPAGGGSEHDIKTRVRGPGARLSDHAEARKAKKVAKNRAAGKGASPVQRTRPPRNRDKVSFVGNGGKTIHTTYGDFVRRFNSGDPETIDERATALANRSPYRPTVPGRKIQSASRFPPKGARKFRSSSP